MESASCVMTRPTHQVDDRTCCSLPSLPNGNPAAAGARASFSPGRRWRCLSAKPPNAGGEFACPAGKPPFASVARPNLLLSADRANRLALNERTAPNSSPVSRYRAAMPGASADPGRHTAMQTFRLRDGRADKLTRGPMSAIPWPACDGRPGSASGRDAALRPGHDRHVPPDPEAPTPASARTAAPWSQDSGRSPRWPAPPAAPAPRSPRRRPPAQPACPGCWSAAAPAGR